MKKSIVTKIMLLVGVLILVMLLCQVVFSVFFSRMYFIEYKKNSVEALFHLLSSEYSDDPDKIYTLTQQAEDDNINILILGDWGVVYSNRNINIPLLRATFFNRGLGEDSGFAKKPRAVVTAFQRSNLEVISLMGQFRYNEENRYVVIETPVESIEASVGLLSRANIAISVVVLALGILCAFVFARKFSSPIREIQLVAQNVANLKFDVRADEDIGTTELGDLSVSINIMAEKLKMLIADLKEKNERLQGDIEHQMRLDKMRREFVANVSHELKTPLCLLLMYSENLKNNIDAIDKDFYCDTIIDEVRKLDEMAKSLLDLASIENGLSRMHMQTFDFSFFCRSVLSRMDVLFQGIHAEFHLRDDLWVTGDPHFLEQAMKNYVMNAVSHTQQGGTVRVQLTQDAEKAVFSVFNEGAPIDQTDAEQIWESFYKTDKARVREDENHAGLGLYIVKTIVDAHSGAYGLLNYENGVEFWFSLTSISHPYSMIKET